MDKPHQKVKLLFTCNEKSQGNSGILIDDNWILTCAAPLGFISKKHLTQLSNELPSGEMLVFQSDVKSELEVLYDNSKTSKHTSWTVVCWKCPALTKCIINDLDSTCSKNNQLYLSTFVVISLKTVKSDLAISKARMTLLDFARNHLSVPTRGNDVQMESTGQGIVSNVFGAENCVFMIDVAPGSEGAPVYLTKNSNCQVICGMTMMLPSLTRRQNDFTFAANLLPCLARILNLDELPQQAPTCPLINKLDKSVAIVSCGSNWGTGFLLDKRTLVTCSHVLRESNDRDIRISFVSGNSTTTLTGELVYRTTDDFAYDVAIVRIAESPLAPLCLLGRGDAVQGEEVISMGYPFCPSGLPTVTRGLVSKSLDCMLQTTCCILNGASGGPLIRRSNGELLGIVVCNVVGRSDIVYPRINFVVPWTAIKEPIMKYLQSYDERVLQKLQCEDETVQRTWRYLDLPQSKL